jgi:hypothetical protein
VSLVAGLQYATAYRNLRLYHISTLPLRRARTSGFRPTHAATMKAATFIRQMWALVRKNLIINLRRHHSTTLIRAFLLPIIYVAFLSYSRNLLVPPSKFGIGTAVPVRDLGDTLQDVGKKLVFVHQGLGGEVDTLIATMERELSPMGQVVVLEQQDELRKECKQSLRGVSLCFAAVVFESSPNTGDGEGWKYILRGDLALSNGRVNVEKHDNGVQEYVCPRLRREVYWLIGTELCFRCSLLWIVQLRSRKAITVQMMFVSQSICTRP